MIKKNNVLLLVILSIIPCIFYCGFLLTPYNNYLYTSLFKIIMFAGFPAIYFLINKKETIMSILKVSGNRKYLKLSALLGFSCMLVIIIFYMMLRDMIDTNMILEGLFSEGITKNNFPYVFINIIFVNAFLEEVFFRGFLFMTLFNTGYKKFAYIYSAVLFSLYHTTMIMKWFNPMIFILLMTSLVLAGFIFNELYRRCDNIYGGYFLHVGANLGINLIGLYLFLN